MMARDAKTSNCSACAKCSSSSPCARSCRQKPGAHVDREDKDKQGVNTSTHRHTQRRRHTQRHTKRHHGTHQVRHDIHILSRYKRDTHHIKIQAGQKLGKSVLKASYKRGGECTFSSTTSTRTCTSLQARARGQNLSFSECRASDAACHSSHLQVCA